MLKALANGRRLMILRVLKKQKEVTVGDIAKAIKLSFKATSRHLSILSSSGIVEREQRRLNVFYRVAADPSTAAHRILALL